MHAADERWTLDDMVAAGTAIAKIRRGIAVPTSRGAHARDVPPFQILTFAQSRSGSARVQRRTSGGNTLRACQGAYRSPSRVYMYIFPEFYRLFAYYANTLYTYMTMLYIYIQHDCTSL